MIRYSILLIALIGTLNNWAQVIDNFTKLQFDQSNGLNANNVFGIDQDAEGYIWIGTDAGVFRFNGLTFKQFDKKHGLISNIITRVYCQKDTGVLLIGQYPEAQFKIKKNEVRRLEDGSNWSIKGIRTSAFPHDSIYFFLDHSAKQLVRYDYSSSPASYKLDGHTINLLLCIKNKVRITTRDSGYLELRNGHLSRHFITDLHNKRVVNMAEDLNGNIWAIGEDNLYIENGEKWQHKCKINYGVENPRIMHTTWDGHGHLWMAGIYKGLYYFDKKTNEVNRIDQQLGLENVQITYLFRDRDNNLWISTMGHGLYCIKKSLFSRYSMDGFSVGKHVTAMNQLSDNSILVGSNSGFYKINVDSSGNSHQFKLLDNNEYVLSFTESSNNIIVSASAEGNIKPVQIPGFSKVLARMSFQLDSSIFGIGGWSSMHMAQLNPNFSRGFEILIRHKIEGRAVSFCESNNKKWLLTSKKLYTIEGEILTEFPIATSDSKDLNYNAMVKTQDGSLWIASNRGVFKFNLEKITNRISTTDGLISDHCLCLTFDQDSTMWIGTDKGLCRFRNGAVTNYSMSNGLPSNYISTLVCDKKSKSLWIGTANGLSYLKLKNLETMKSPSFSLVIDQLTIPGDTTVNNPSDIMLKSHWNNPIIHFTSLKFTHPSEVVYRFRLNNVNSKWTTTTRNQVEYLALASGNYLFEVQSKTPGSFWSKSSMLRFKIPSPIWFRWYFLLGVFLTIGSLVYWLVTIRIRNIQKQELKERRNLATMSRLEQSALQASMNPHFIFNSLSAIQNYLTRHKDLEAINFVGEFAQLVRQNMESSRSNKINLQIELDNLKRYLSLEAKRLNNHLSYSIELEPEIDTEEIEIPSMLIQPFVENAIWHGIAPSNKPGKITIKLEKIGNLLMISIEDNGVGFNNNKVQTSKRHISRGIQLSRTRLQLSSKQNKLDISEQLNDSGTPAGTLVRLQILI